MFKDVTGNANLQVSLNGEFRTRDGEACTLPSHGGTLVEVPIYNELVVVCSKWLALISHFEVYLPVEFRSRLYNIHFTECSNKAVLAAISGYEMVFRRPILIKPGFRLVPGFTRYAVNSDGDILEISTGQLVPQYTIGDSAKMGYIFSEIYSAVTGRKHSVGVHRLVARAWVKNPDWKTKWQINHIDGNKKNPRASNLEWASPSENNTHAVNEGLRNDNCPCKFRSAKTGEIREFASLNQATKVLGVYRLSIDEITERHPSFRIDGEWEVRLNGDETPWYAEMVGDIPRGTKFIIRVTMPDGEFRQYVDLRDFTKDLKLWNTKDLDLKLEKAKRLYPGISIDVEQRFTVTPIQVLTLASGEILEVESKKKAQRLTGECQQNVSRSIRNNGRISYNGYAFREATIEPWPIEEINTSRELRCISATRTDDGSSMTFDSLRSAARFFKADRSRIKNRIVDGGSIDGWTLREIVEKG